MSVTRRPDLAMSSKLFVKILSIRVAVCEVSLVGLVISGTNDLENITSKNVPLVTRESN